MIVIAETTDKARRIGGLIRHHTQRSCDYVALRGALRVNGPTSPYQFSLTTPTIGRVTRKAKGCSVILLAFDPDDYGDALAWSVYHHLSERLSSSSFLRISLRDTSSESVRDALSAPVEPKYGGFEAWLARKLVDQVVISHVENVTESMLGAKVKLGVLAAYALGLVVSNGETVHRLTGEPGISSRRFSTERDAHNNRIIGVFSKTTSTVTVPPPNPFNLTGLLGAAARFDLDTHIVMDVLQILYNRGVVTFPYTSGTGVTARFADDSSRLVDSMGGVCVTVTPSCPIGILPTDPFKLPNTMKNKDLEFIYRLVWARAVCSVLEPCTTERTLIAWGNKFPVARKAYEVVSNLGWRALSGGLFDSRLEAPQSAPDALVLTVASGSKGITDNALYEQLESLGAGSAYDIRWVVPNLLGQHLVVRGDRGLVPTDAGKAVHETLRQTYPPLFRPSFVRVFEAAVQQVRCGGLLTARSLLKHYWYKLKGGKQRVARFSRGKCPSCGRKPSLRIHRQDVYRVCGVCRKQSRSVVLGNKIKRFIDG